MRLVSQGDRLRQGLGRTNHWLIILGRSATQERAIREIVALPPDHPRRGNILRLLASWKVRIDLGELQDFEERGTVMALSQAFLEWEQATQTRSLQEGRQEGRREGRQEGERAILQRLLTVRFGPLPETITATIASLSLAHLESLSLALFDFTSLSDLEAWLVESQLSLLLSQLAERLNNNSTAIALPLLSLTQLETLTQGLGAVEQVEDWQSWMLETLRLGLLERMQERFGEISESVKAAIYELPLEQLGEVELLKPLEAVEELNQSLSSLDTEMFQLSRKLNEHQ